MITVDDKVFEYYETRAVAAIEDIESRVDCDIKTLSLEIMKTMVSIDGLCPIGAGASGITFIVKAHYAKLLGRIISVFNITMEKQFYQVPITSQHGGALKEVPGWNINLVHTGGVDEIIVELTIILDILNELKKHVDDENTLNEDRKHHADNAVGKYHDFCEDANTPPTSKTRRR